jgi:dihydropyrimidinase
LTLSVDTLHEKVDWTPYEGLRVRGWTDTTISRGQVIVAAEEFLGKAGYGRFVPRSGPIRKDNPFQ